MQDFDVMMRAFNAQIIHHTDSGNLQERDRVGDAKAARALHRVLSIRNADDRKRTRQSKVSKRRQKTKQRGGGATAPAGDGNGALTSDFITFCRYAAKTAYRKISSTRYPRMVPTSSPGIMSAKKYARW